MAYVYSNYAYGVLAAELAQAGATLTITTTETFPTTDNFKAVIWDSGESAPQEDLTREVMTLKWDAVESRYDIIGRGEEGTVAKLWTAGSKIAHVMTATQATAFETAAGYLDQAVKQASSPTFAGLTLSGLTASEIVATDGDKKLQTLAIATYPSLAELAYVKGVSSAIQTQINAKAPSTAPTFATSITGSYLTVSEMLITDADKKIVSAPVATYPSLTELSYVKGITSAIQTQFAAKVTGPASAVDNNIAVFDGTTGKIIKDGGKKVTSFVEGAGARAVLRAFAFFIQPGATPNTNINITKLSATYGFNVPTTTDATNLAKNATSGSWSLSADGRVITLDLTENIVGILGITIFVGKWNTAEAVPYYIQLVLSGDNLQLLVYKVGTTTSADWTTILDANDYIQVVASFITSS